MHFLFIGLALHKFSDVRVISRGRGSYGEGSLTPRVLTGGDWRWASEERRSVVVERVGEAVGGLVIETFVSEGKYFELDMLCDRKPVALE